MEIGYNKIVRVKYLGKERDITKEQEQQHDRINTSVGRDITDKQI